MFWDRHRPDFGFLLTELYGARLDVTFDGICHGYPKLCYVEISSEVDFSEKTEISGWKPTPAQTGPESQNRSGLAAAVEKIPPLTV